MSLPDLVLSYRHDAGDTCTGSIRFEWPDNSRPAILVRDFEKDTFNRMMSNTSRALSGHDVRHLVVERTDHQGLKPIVMDNPTVELLRSDPIAAIQQMTVPPIHIDLRPKREEPVPVFSAGYDALAWSVGEEVFARVRGEHTECPCCGTWCQFVAENEISCRNATCGLVISARFVHGWAAVSTKMLLALGRSRYYLPRVAKGFISHADLERLYNDWKKESTS